MFSMSASPVLDQNIKPYVLRRIQPAVLARWSDQSLRPRFIVAHKPNRPAIALGNLTVHSSSRPVTAATKAINQ